MNIFGDSEYIMTQTLYEKNTKIKRPCKKTPSTVSALIENGAREHSFVSLAALACPLRNINMIIGIFLVFEERTLS